MQADNFGANYDAACDVIVCNLAKMQSCLNIHVMYYTWKYLNLERTTSPIYNNDNDKLIFLGLCDAEISMRIKK